MKQLELFQEQPGDDSSRHHDTDELKTVAEYFAGIGLVRLGLERAGWRTVFANDFSPQKHEMYASYFDESDDHYLVDDVFSLDPGKVPKTLLATSSFPCIDLSLAGNLNGIEKGKHSSAFWGFLKILQGQGDERPPLVMLENVPGWLTSNQGNDFRITVEALNRLGYACDVFNLDALRFTPQSRLRIFMIGSRVERPANNMQDFFRRPSSLVNKRLRMAVSANSDLNWHINSVPQPPVLRSAGLASIIEQINDDDERWWSEEEVERHLKMMAPKHYERVKALEAEDRVSYRTIYRRRRNGEQRAEVRKGDTAGCLRTARGGSSRQIVIAAGNGRIRMRHMTPREYARLQGVPDDYPIPENVIQALTGFGDAVCVPAITWIGENALNPLVVGLTGQSVG